MLELSDDEGDEDDMEVSEFLPDMDQFQKIISDVNNDVNNDEK